MAYEPKMPPWGHIGESEETLAHRAIHRACVDCLGSAELVEACLAFRCGFFNMRNGPDYKKIKND